MDISAVINLPREKFYRPIFVCEKLHHKRTEPAGPYEKASQSRRLSVWFIGARILIEWRHTAH